MHFIDFKEDIVYLFSGLWFWTPLKQLDTPDQTVKSKIVSINTRYHAVQCATVDE